MLGGGPVHHREPTFTMSNLETPVQIYLHIKNSGNTHTLKHILYTHTEQDSNPLYWRCEGSMLFIAVVCCQMT